MERLTKKDGTSYAADCDHAQLLARLGQFEDLWEYVTNDQAALPARLEALRASGKEKSYQFRELMGRKLSNVYVLSLFQQFKLK